MEFELFRLETFKDWPADAPVTKERLARGGFYYLKDKLKVMCFKCGVIIENWDYGDQAVARHKDASPQCVFICDEPNSENVPLREVNEDKLKDVAVRLATFAKWPKESIVKATDLAMAGFYYLQIQDQTKCIYCGGVCMEWLYGDDPKVIHKNFFPSCTIIEAFMEVEVYRELSFNNWPRSGDIDPKKLAKAGFFYLGRDDITKCFCCGGIGRDWNHGDDPDVEHQRHFPNCKFVKDVIEPRLNQHENVPSRSHSDSEEPTHPSYNELDKRLESFRTWPSNLHQKPGDLADAGFFYGGVGDLVKCFYCNGGLQQWHQDDIPWVEHAKWFQNCAYVRQKKSTEFIDNCLAKRGTESSLSDFLSSRETQEAIAMDIDASIIRRAIIEHVKEYGCSFQSSELLVDYALNLQVKNESPETSQAKPLTNLEEVYEENRALREAKLCKICMDSDLEIVFLPCAHFATCDNCSVLVLECPICRRKIENRLKTFLS